MPDQSPITDPRELQDFLAIPESQVPTVATPQDPLLPRARRTLEQVTGPLTEEGFIEREQRPGIPLQVNPAEGELSDVSPWVRFQTARRQNLADQQAYLETKFGKGKVRKAKDTDDFIVEMMDPDTGKARDVKLNEDQITLGDLGALAAQTPEVAASMLAAAAGGPIGGAARGPALVKMLMKFAGTGPGKALLGAGGFKAGQAAEQIETELEQGQRAQPLAIAGQKAKEIPVQAALDLATAGIFKTASTINRVRKGGPGMFQTPVEKEGLPAAERLGGKYGQRLSYTGGEASGMPLLDYLEAYAGAKPQSAAIVQQFKDLQIAEQKALGEAMTAKGGTDEEAGRRLLAFLNANQAKKQAALDAARATMTFNESQALTRQLGKFAKVGGFKPSEAGEQFRKDVQSAYQGVKGKVQAAYLDAYGVPGAAMPVVPTKAIANEIDSIVGQFSQFNKVEGVQWLKQYKNTLEPTESYKDIVNRRSDLWDKIEQSPADRSTKDYLHSQLSATMTQTLDDASKSILNPKFRSLIQKANSIYKKEELPYYQEGLHDILRKAGQRGSPENTELVDRFAGSTDLYRRMVSVLGKDSPPDKAIKASVVDGIIGKSGSSAIDPQDIDARKLIENLQNFASDPKTREMFNDIFGNRGKAILAQAKVMGAIQGTIPKEEAELLLAAKAAPKSSRVNLGRMLAAQNQLNRVEAKRLISSPTEYVNPEDLANRYVEHLTESELKILSDRMKREAPPLYAQLQDKLTEQILGKAGTYKTWTGSSIEKALNDPKMASKYKMILGDKFNDIQDFAKALGPRERAEEIGKATGLLIKGESVGELAQTFKVGGKRKTPLYTRVMEIVPGWLGWKMATRFITSGTFRDWASKGYPKGWEKNIMAGIMAEPFLADLASSSGSPGVLRHVALATRQWANRVSATPEQKQEQAPIQDVEELRRFLNE